MGWQNTTVSPSRQAPPKVNIRYPCPAISRMAFVIGFFGVGLGIYYGGCALFRVPRLDWAAPAWTVKHVLLIVAGMIIGALVGLVGFAAGMLVEVRNERLSDLLIILWQFLWNGSIAWFVAIGIAMTLALGKEGAKAAILHFGAERATLYVIGIGCFVGLLLGLGFFMGPLTGLPVPGYIVYGAAMSLLLANLQFHVYGIQSKWWVAAGLAVPILLLFLTPGTIQRDRRQRRLMIEQAHRG